MGVGGGRGRGEMSFFNLSTSKIIVPVATNIILLLLLSVFAVTGMRGGLSLRRCP